MRMTLRNINKSSLLLLQRIKVRYLLSDINFLGQFFPLNDNFNYPCTPNDSKCLPNVTGSQTYIYKRPTRALEYIQLTFKCVLF